jgi:Ca-activated chloride channel family protein
MRQHWPEIQRTLLMLPERLGPEDRLSLVAFGEDVQLSLEALTSSDWPMWREHVRQLQPDGSADIADGIRESLTVAFNTSSLPGNLQKELIFISDHEGVWNTDSLDAAAGLLKEGTSAGVQTSVIDFATARDDRETCLGILAEAGGVKSFGIVNTGPRDDRQSPLLSWEQLRFQPIGSEVELSMEFNPQAVAAYRLVGHDSGSWAAVNHKAQPLEFRPGDARSAQVEIAFKLDAAEEIGRLNLQWRDPADGEVKQRQVRVLRGDFTRPWTEMPAWYQRSVVAAELAEVLRGSRQALRETNWSDGTAHDYSRLLEIVRRTSSELTNDPDTVRLIRAAEAWRKLSNR